MPATGILTLVGAGLVLFAVGPETMMTRITAANVLWPLLILLLAIVIMIGAHLIFVRREKIRFIGTLEEILAALPDAKLPGPSTPPLEAVTMAHEQLLERLRALENETEQQLVAYRLQGYKRERVEAILESFPDAVLFVDGEGKALVCNAKIGLLAGMGPDSAIGLGLADWPIAETLRQAVGDLIAGLQAGRAGIAHVVPDPLVERRISIIARPVHAVRAQERLLGTLLLFRDTTDEWLAYKSRDEFLANISHELKSPLGNILMYGEQLRDEFDPANTQAVEFVNTICDEADRMKRLIENLLDISRIEAGTFAPDLQRVRMHDLLNDCMENAEYSAKLKGLVTRTEVPREMAPVKMDKSLIRIAISNLLNNAVKYNRPGGEVVLGAEATPEGILLSVQDTGLGIPQEDIPLLFEKHYRSSDAEAVARGGHGLGLYLVKRIVSLHHGRIEVFSKLGEGSRFQIFLPSSNTLLQ